MFGERHEYVDEWEKYKVNKIIFTSYDKGLFFQNKIILKII